MKQHARSDSAKLTEEAMLSRRISKLLSAGDIDEAFRAIGRYMDKHRHQMSQTVLEEFRIAGRIASQKIN